MITELDDWIHIFYRLDKTNELREIEVSCIFKFQLRSKYPDIKMNRRENAITGLIPVLGDPVETIFHNIKAKKFAL